MYMYHSHDFLLILLEIARDNELNSNKACWWLYMRMLVSLPGFSNVLDSSNIPSDSSVG